MNEIVLNEQKKFFDNVDTIIQDNRLSHAYFLETNSYSKYRQVLVELCRRILKENTSSVNFNLINENFDYPEIKLLEANGKIIKKEDIISLKNSCLEKAVIGKYIIYIIDGAEFLNASSANTLLKFLEEPEENIIGILVSNNKYQVIDTLISRCQILSLVPEAENNNGYNEEVVAFVTKIHEKNYDLFLENNKLYLKDKEEILLFLDSVERYCLDDKCDVINMDIITIIEKKKNELKYNLNLKLFLDNLILELIEVAICTN